MRKFHRYLILLASFAFLFVFSAFGQDDAPPPSLGDVARQARQQKQQKTADEGKPAAGDAQAEATDANTVKKDAPSKDSAANTDSTQNKAAKPAPAASGTKKIITNDEIPEHAGPAHAVKTNGGADDAQNGQSEESSGKETPEYWKTRIQSQKTQIASLKSDIDGLESSIKYAPANCVSGCVQWNEHQQEKQQQVDAMKLQLGEQQKQLEETQDAARKQGYGSAVYDP